MSKLFVTVDHDIYIPKHEALGWKEERDDLRAEVERLNEHIDDLCARVHSQPKPVVWVRENASANYHRVTELGDGFYKYHDRINPPYERFDWWKITYKDIATVRVWEPQAKEPEYEWEYGVWEVEDMSFQTWHRNEWWGTWCSFKGALAYMHEIGSPPPSGDQRVGTPLFGVRKIRLGDMPHVSGVGRWYVNNRCYGAFRDGKYIKGSPRSIPEACVEWVKKQLAKPITTSRERTLADLEVA